MTTRLEYLKDFLTAEEYASLQKFTETHATEFENALLEEFDPNYELNTYSATKTVPAAVLQYSFYWGATDEGGSYWAAVQARLNKKSKPRLVKDASQ